MGFPAELRRLRSDGENVLAQAEREKHALTQTLNAAQLEAQQALRKAISEHQEEVERLVSEKVRRFSGSVLLKALPGDLFLLSRLRLSMLATSNPRSVFTGGGAAQPADGARGHSEKAQAGGRGAAPQSGERERAAAGRAEESPA